MQILGAKRPWTKRKLRKCEINLEASERVILVGMAPEFSLGLLLLLDDSSPTEFSSDIAADSDDDCIACDNRCT